MIRAALILACLASPAAAQFLGNRQTLDCAALVEGNMVDSSIQVICGIPPAEMTEMVRLAVSGRPEDYSALLSRLDDLTPDGAQLKTESIRSFFQILKQDEVPPEQIRDRLAEIARRHIELQDELTAFQVADPDIQARIDAAAAALAADPPDHNAARAQLAEARDLRREKREAAQALLDDQSREEARIIRSQAELEASVLNRLEAATLYEEAADTLPTKDELDRSENLSLAAGLLLEHGESTGTSRFIKRSIIHYTNFLAQLDRSAEPLKWAEAQFTLGQAILSSGIIDRDKRQLEQALSAFNAAQEEHTRTRSPLDWAHAQRYIADTQYFIGDFFGDIEHLKSSIESYQLALQEYSISCSGKCYAAAQHSLGNALISLSDYESDDKHLKAAVDAFNEALKINDREFMPSEWADDQRGLGHVYYKIGIRNADPEWLDDAVASFRLALEVRDRRVDPRRWANAQQDLGVSLSALGELTNKSDILEEAIAHYNLALEKTNIEENINSWLTTKNNVGVAYYKIGIISGEPFHLESAAIIFEEILSETDRERRPLDWASIQNSLGNIRLALGEHDSGTERLEEAAAAYRSALQEYVLERIPSDWARTTAALAYTNSLLAERNGRIDLTRQALQDATEAASVLRQHGHVPLAEYAAWVVGEIKATIARMEER